MVLPSRREDESLPLTELFSPFTLNGLTLPNRIVMAPMTRNFSPGGARTPAPESVPAG
jgi:2,4-dienoyl-CoA reductase-like NADH-dependent reductase (Old Yellow Enzyme family)